MDRSNKRAVMTLLAAILAVGVGSDFLGARAAGPTWSSAGNLATARLGFTTTVLKDGKVLVVGGLGQERILASAELYDPSTNTWSSGGSMATARTSHTATLLPNGRVLVVGGYRSESNHYLPLKSAEVYDPAANQWSSAPDMGVARMDHVATALSDGEVLVVGGETTPLGNPVRTIGINLAEIYDGKAWKDVVEPDLLGSLTSATLLSDGRVLVLPAFQIFDPRSGSWSLSATAATVSGGSQPVLLPDGRVLIAGGAKSQTWPVTGPIPLNTAALYDPSRNAWLKAASMATPRLAPQAILLKDGRVLVVGGAVATATEIYDPDTDSWSPGDLLPDNRSGFTAVQLPLGHILIIGGTMPGDSTMLPSAEISIPIGTDFRVPRSVLSLLFIVFVASALLLVVRFSSRMLPETMKQPLRYAQWFLTCLIAYALTQRLAFVVSHALIPSIVLGFVSVFFLSRFFRKRWGKDFRGQPATIPQNRAA